MKVSEILSTAAEIVDGNRHEKHGDRGRTLDNVAALWNAYLSIRAEPTTELDAVDVAEMMGLLKVARTQSGEHNDDDYVDGCGYRAIAGELASDD